MKRQFITLQRMIVFGLIAGLTSVSSSAGSPDGNSSLLRRGEQSSENAEIVYKPLPKPGKKYEIGDGVYLIYEFSEKPKMGTVILKIQIFNRNGEKITPYAIKGRSDMPSMRGAHDSGDQDFKLNKKNDYLLPVNIVMPGDWEIRVTFLTDGKPVFHGSLTFDV